jgi:hypothetical protein
MITSVAEMAWDLFRAETDVGIGDSGPVPRGNKRKVSSARAEGQRRLTSVSTQAGFFVCWESTQPVRLVASSFAAGVRPHRMYPRGLGEMGVLCPGRTVRGGAGIGVTV